jgi:hypothetical protein
VIEVPGLDVAGLLRPGPGFPEKSQQVAELLVSAGGEDVGPLFGGDEYLTPGRGRGGDVGQRGWRELPFLAGPADRLFDCVDTPVLVEDDQSLWRAIQAVTWPGASCWRVSPGGSDNRKLLRKRR